MSIMLELETGNVSKYEEVYNNTAPIEYLAKFDGMKFNSKLLLYKSSIGGDHSLNSTEKL